MRLMVSILLVLASWVAAAATELKVGLIPEQNVFLQVERYKPIGQYIEEQTGIKIRFTILSRYGNIIDSFTTEKMDAAFWGSFTAALAIEKLGIEPIARPIWLDKSSTYHGYIFVRKDDGITEPRHMKGKVMAFVEKATTAGYVFPMAYLREHGVTDINEHFKEYFFAGSHDATIAAVLNRKADIGCAKNTIFNIVAGRDPRVNDELVIIARSPSVPSNGLGIRKDLDPAIRKALQDCLLGMTESEAGRARLRDFKAIRFVRTTKEDYAPVFDVARRAGIDLKEYHYVNE